MTRRGAPNKSLYYLLHSTVLRESAFLLSLPVPALYAPFSSLRRKRGGLRLGEGGSGKAQEELASSETASSRSVGGLSPIYSYATMLQARGAGC